MNLEHYGEWSLMAFVHPYKPNAMIRLILVPGNKWETGNYKIEEEIWICDSISQVKHGLVLNLFGGKSIPLDLFTNRIDLIEPIKVDDEH